MTTDDDRERLVKIGEAAGGDADHLVRLVFAYYHDQDRADRTERSTMYLHLGILSGAISRLTEHRRRVPRVLRIRYRILGGHVHCRLFVAPDPDTTFAPCGALVFSLEEWPDVCELLSLAVEILPENAAVDPGVDCICRTAACGHRASQHTGPGGECVVCHQACWA